MVRQDRTPSADSIQHWTSDTGEKAAQKLFNTLQSLAKHAFSIAQPSEK